MSGAGAPRRGGEAALDCQAIGSTLTEQDRTARLGKGGERCTQGTLSGCIGRDEPEGSSRRGWRPCVTTSSSEASDASWTASCRGCSERDMSSGTNTGKRLQASTHAHLRSGSGQRQEQRQTREKGSPEAPEAQGVPRRASTSRSVEHCASRSPG